MISIILTASLWLTYDKAYNDFEVNGKPMVIMITADWCPACKVAKPKLETLIKKNYFQDISPVLIDADDELIKLMLPGGTTLPTFLVYGPNDFRRMLVGYDEKALIKYIDLALKEKKS